MIGRKDYEKYLIRLYFGNSGDLLGACINGSSMKELKSVLKYPERLLFVPRGDGDGL